MPSLLDIVAHTPAAVWVALSVLVAIGVRQLRTHTVVAAKVWIVPLIVGVASLAGALRGFAGAGALLTGACWAAGTAVGFASNRWLDLPRRVGPNADGSFTIGGSVAPLLIFLSVFMERYVIGVALAIRPSLALDPAAAAAAAIAFGLTAGLLAARSRKIWSTRRAAAGLLAA